METPLPVCEKILDWPPGGQMNVWKKDLGIFMLPSLKSSWLRLQEQLNQPTES